MSEKTKKGEKNKYPKEILEKARLAYLNYEKLAKIAEQTGINIDTIKYHIRTHWKLERDMRQHEILEVLTENKRKDLVEITHHGLTYLRKALETLSSSPAELNPATMKVVSEIVFKINHIHSLDQGKPTSISAELKPATVVEVRELLMKDPFHAPIEEIEYKEVQLTTGDNDDKDS